MLLPFTDGLVVSNGSDWELSWLADRHYSRRTIGARQFMNNGRKLVLRDTPGTVVFGWLWPQSELRFDDQVGYNNAIFRNESSRLSSDIILEAEAMAFEKWGPNRLYTYVDPMSVRFLKPAGWCFVQAGWEYVRQADGSYHYSKSGQVLLQKHAELAR